MVRKSQLKVSSERHYPVPQLKEETAMSSVDDFIADLDASRVALESDLEAAIEEAEAILWLAEAILREEE